MVRMVKLSVPRDVEDGAPRKRNTCRQGPDQNTRWASREGQFRASLKVAEFTVGFDHEKGGKLSSALHGGRLEAFEKMLENSSTLPYVIVTFHDASALEPPLLGHLCPLQHEGETESLLKPWCD